MAGQLNGLRVAFLTANEGVEQVDALRWGGVPDGADARWGQRMGRLGGWACLGGGAQRVRRRNAAALSATDAMRIPPHHATACHPLAPVGVPSSRPRRVSMTGVAGWWLAKPCSQAGIVRTGTKALLA